MAIKDVGVKIQLSELENVIMIAHCKAVKEENLSRAEEIKSIHVCAVMQGIINAHLTGVKPISEEELQDARRADATANILWQFFKIMGGNGDENIENHDR